MQRFKRSIVILNKESDEMFMYDIKVVTICGSMKFSKEMMKISEELELKQGYAVIQCVYNADSQRYGEIDVETLDRVHRKKIEICDAIYVVNVNGYIGDSTQNEIVYAKSLGKEILSLEPIE